ncbi:MAG: acyltransferase [Plectolyngbya sp. WJT66-NPBG17]|jgi:peptidoglycan/LPS O-acetylase OafA/YrhL|nr:acyltransferase [Plectolyngbya sp. WJT66-NPBG17]
MTASPALKELNLLSSFESNSQNCTRRAFDWALEGLRGYAALAVGFYHVLGPELDPGFQPNRVLGYLTPGPICVLLFFVLSGYVIGLTTTGEFSKPALIQYLMRRVIRLVPIYWIAIALTIPFATGVSWTTIAGNALFLQEILVPVITGNEALWSLSYEVVFYLLFLLIWWLRPKVITVFAIVFGLSLLGRFLHSSAVSIQSISNFSTGFVFWLIGLWLAWKVEPSPNVKKIPLFSYLCLFLAFYHIRPLGLLFQVLGWSLLGPGKVNLATLGWLPISLLFIAGITQRQFPGFKLIQVICLLVPVANLIPLLLKGRIFQQDFWILLAVITVLAIALWRVRMPSNVFNIFAPMGQISYAFYVIHLPVMHGIYQYFPLEGTIWSYSLRVLTWFGVSIGLSILLERVLQPMIRAKLSPLLIPKSS